MADCLILRNFKVEINLHTSLVSVSRHGVPGAARLKFRHTHLELASWNNLLHEHPVDDAMVALFESSELHLDSLCTSCKVVRMSAMCR